MDPETLLRLCRDEWPLQLRSACILSCLNFIAWIQEQDRKKKEQEVLRKIRKHERNGSSCMRVHICCMCIHNILHMVHALHIHVSSEARAVLMRNAEILWDQILQVGWSDIHTPAHIHAYSYTHSHAGWPFGGRTSTRFVSLLQRDVIGGNQKMSEGPRNEIVAQF